EEYHLRRSVETAKALASGGARAYREKLARSAPRRSPPMRVVRWLPLAAVLPACGGAGGGGSPGDGGGGMTDATAGDVTAADSAGGGMDVSTSDGANDG